MKGAPEQSNGVTLPQALEEQFLLLEKRLWKVDTAVAAAGIVLSFAFSAFSVFIADRLAETPPILRTVLLLLGLGGAIYFALQWARHWVWHRRGKRALAVLVQRRYRVLGDRLLGIVELTDEQKHPANFSPELYQAAVRQVALEAEKFDFASTVNVRRLKQVAVIAAVALALECLPSLVLPQAAWSSFRRWLAPLGATPRYTLVRLEQIPAELIVPHGEPFQVTLPISYKSFWRPQRARWQFEDQPSILTKVQEGKVAAQLPSQTRNGILKVKVGDVTARIAILPTARPALKEMRATVHLPKYLEQPPREEAVKLGALTILEGSEVKLQAATTRALQEARLLEPEGPVRPLLVKSNEFFAEQTNTAAAAQWLFQWKDLYGLTNGAPWRLAVQTQKDLPPAAEFPDQPRDIAILLTDVVPIKAGARDDYGVKQFGLLWEVASEWQKTNDVSRQKFSSVTENSSSRKAEDIFSFSPALYDVPADSTVEIRAFATDYYPDREPSESVVYRIYVLGNEKHAEMVRQRLESLLVRLEEVTRLEEKIASNTRDLEAKETPSEKKIQEAKDQQDQNANDLREMSKEGARTLREALRNPAFPQEMVRDWAKTLQSMQDLAQSEMKEASESLQASASSPKGAKQNLQKAAKKENEALNKLQSMQRKVNQGLDNLQALTLAQRLRKVGSREKELQAQLQRNVNDTIGLLPQELPPSLKEMNTSVSEQQGLLQKESQGLKSEISRFFERTQKENYGKVSKEMTDTRTDEELEKVRAQVEQNIAMESMQKLSFWADKFQGWADLLEPKQKEAKGGGSGSGSGEENATKQLMALLRMREGQMTLREQTKLLDKEKPATYADKAKSLQGTQEKIENSLLEMQVQNNLKFLEKPLAQAGESMEDVSRLLGRPKTDKEADVAHVKTIDALTDAINLINEQAQRTPSSPQDSQKEEMDFLMQMMAMGSQPGQSMQTGTSGGGSMAGGNTSQAASPTPGDAKGKASETRRVNKSSGAAGAYPAEFKQALEGYFKALESN